MSSGFLLFYRDLPAKLRIIVRAVDLYKIMTFAVYGEVNIVARCIFDVCFDPRIVPVCDHGCHIHRPAGDVSPDEAAQDYAAMLYFKLGAWVIIGYLAVRFTLVFSKYQYVFIR